MVEKRLVPRANRSLACRLSRGGIKQGTQRRCAKKSAQGISGERCAAGAVKKVPSAVGGRGSMSSLAQREEIIDLVDEAVGSGSTL